ncbi:APC family permease [Corynebacterium casei]|uniref:APC family permease n=1 Tax=Corynebacterium casei TaxID=160386 RepID=UPI003FD0E03B
MSPSSNQPALQKSFKPSWIFAMALGSAIGWGAFVLPFDWMTSSGLLGAIIGLAVGGGLIAVIGCSYGYAIKALPVTGGGVVFAMVALGRAHSFIAGWALMLGYAGIVALNASAVTLVFRVTFPTLFQRMPLYDVAGWTIYAPEVAVASIFILAFAWLNWRGSELSGKFQLWAVVLMIAAVIVIVVVLLGAYLVERPEVPVGIPSDRSAIAAILIMVSFAPWAYVGFDSIPQLAGEFNFSARKALGLLLWGILAATLIYMAMMVATVLAVGTDRSGYEDSAWPPGMAIADVMGPIGLVLMVVAVTMGVLTGLNGFFAASSRVVYSLGNADLIPGIFGQLDVRYKTPRNAILLIAAVCLITPWFGRAALTWVVDMTSVGITFAYFYTCFCAWKIARKGIVPGMKHPLPISRLQQFISATGCVLSICFLALLLVPGSPGMLDGPALIALLVWLIVGAIYYVLMMRRLKNVSIEVTQEKLLQLRA